MKQTQENRNFTRATDSVGSRPRRPARWAVYAAQAFIAAWFLRYLVQGTKLALWFDGFSNDGPFQIFDPLRRIASGQAGGRDFIFFHGIGIPYLHYPLFALFGGNTLIASELSRHFTSLTLFLLSLGAFTWVALRRAPRVWIGAAVSIMVIEALFPADGMSGPYLVGHSLISLRSTMPIFAFAVLQVPIRDSLKAALTGLCVGLALAFGTEHGLSLAISLGFVFAVTLAQKIFLKNTSRGLLFLNFRFILIALSTAIASAALVLIALVGVKGMLVALHFNLVELPADQFWFIGSPPMPYLGAWRQLITDHHLILCFLPTVFAAFALAWILVKSWRRPLRIGTDWQALTILMLFYGMMTGVPLLSTLSRHYVFPLARIVMLTGLVLFANRADPLVMPWQKWSRIASVSFAAVGFAAAAALFAHAAGQATQLVRHLRSDSYAYSRFLDSHWDTFMAQGTHLIDFKRKRNELSLWSTYVSLLEWHYGLIHPTPEDYIIHATGKARWDDYVATFEKTNPEFVQTMTNEFDFEEWLQNERWEFYEALLNNYDLPQRVEHALIWQRKDQPWRSPAGNFQTVQLGPDGQSATLPMVAESDRLGVVRVHYRILNRWGALPLLGNTPRYLAFIEGSPRKLAISFPQYDSEFDFPVQLSPGKPVRLRFRTDTLLPGAAFVPERVEIKILDWQPSRKALFAREKFKKFIQR